MSQKWKLYRKIPSKNQLYEREVLIDTIQNPDGSYRPLDNRTLQVIAAMDLQRRGPDIVLGEAIERQEKAEEREVKQYRDDCEAIAREIRPAVAKDAEELGAINVPKEDMRSMMNMEYGEIY